MKTSFWKQTISTVNKMVPLMILFLILQVSKASTPEEQLVELNNKCSYLLERRILYCANLEQIQRNLGNFITNDTTMIIFKSLKNNIDFPSNFHWTPKFKQITSYQIVNSENVKIKSGDFQGLINVYQMKLQENDMSVIKSNMFIGLRKLINLNLAKNGIEIVEENCFTDLDMLNDLDLSQNKLDQIPNFIFKNLNKLERLYLNHNKIKSIKTNSFEGLINLKMLFLTDNSLKCINSNDFNKLTNIEHLQVDFNKIAIINGDFSLPNLKFLQLNNNELNHLNDAIFEKCPTLTSIDLSNNNLGNLTENQFLILKELKLLNLLNNNVNRERFFNLKTIIHVIM